MNNGNDKIPATNIPLRTNLTLNVVQNIITYDTNFMQLYHHLTRIELGKKIIKMFVLCILTEINAFLQTECCAFQLVIVGCTDMHPDDDFKSWDSPNQN